MSKHDYGLVKEKINLVKKDDELVVQILSNLGLEVDQAPKITSMLYYNQLTVKQVSELTGLKVSTITTKTNPSFKKGDIVTELDHGYPFSTIENLGPKFIIRNEKLEALLRKGK
jgi:hypothetical protein